VAFAGDGLTLVEVDLGATLGVAPHAASPVLDRRMADKPPIVGFVGIVVLAVVVLFLAVGGRLVVVLAAVVRTTNTF
jgi:hypothetical protein